MPWHRWAHRLIAASLKVREQPVCRFSGAGKRAGENLRVSDEEGFLSRHCILGEAEKDFEMVWGGVCEMSEEDRVSDPVADPRDETRVYRWNK